MGVTVTPFAAGLGADISGVDVREPLRTVDRDAIRAAWLANLVLRFRGQPMTDEQHMAFTRQFGELEFNPAALIAELKERMIAPDGEYHHVWRKGDVVIWDNRCSYHKAAGDYPPEEDRIHWRVSINDYGVEVLEAAE